MARRTDLLNRITKQLAILAHEIELMNRSNRMTLNSDAETIFCGLINRLEGWDLRNLNEVAQNYPGIDLADPDRRIAVQITASASQKKVSHTLEVFFKNRMERNFDRLILVIITDKAAPTNGSTMKPGFRFDPKRDIWNIEWFKRRAESVEDCELLQAVADFLDSQLGDLPGSVKRPDHLLPPVPGASEFFLEGSRDAELAVFEKALEKGGPVFIWGLGGMGKTQTAIQLANRCEPPRGAYFLRYTVPADPGREAMWETIRRADLSGYALDAGEETDPEVLMEKEYREKLEILQREYADTLLIIDNFDAPGKSMEMLKAERSYQDVAALANQGVSLVFTTRYPAAPAWEVGPLPEERLLELMRKSCADYEDAELLELIRAVGGHTLMVDLMAKTLEESWQTVTPEQIQEALKNAALDLADFPEVTSDKDGLFAQAQIYRHLQALFNLSGLNAAAKKVLSLAILIAEEGLDDVLFLESLPAAEKKELQNLCKRGWLRREDHVVTIHPAVLQVCRGKLKPEEADVQAFLDGLWNGQEKRKCGDMTLRRVAMCLTAGADCIFDRERYFEWKKRTVELWERVLPADHPDLALVYSDMGSVSSFLGRKYDALRFRKKALNIKKQNLTDADPDLAHSYANVGLSYLWVGDYASGLDSQLKALAMWQHILPGDHPELAEAYAAVSLAYTALGDYPRALEYELKNLAIKEKNLPGDHPELAHAHQCLGRICREMGEKERADRHFEKAARILERGRFEDELAQAEHDIRIAEMYKEWGNLDQALEYLHKALQIYRRKLDRHHPQIAETLHDIAQVYMEARSWELARQYDLEALEVLGDVRRSDYVNLVIWIYNELGGCHALLDQDQTALEYFRKAAALMEAAAPQDSPEFRNSKQQLRELIEMLETK